TKSIVTGTDAPSSGSCASASPAMAAMTTAPATTIPAAARAAARTITINPRDSAQRGRTLGAIRGLHRLRAKLHVMRPAQLFLVEVDLEGRLQLLAVPGKAPHELLVVGAALVPLREQRGGDVDARAIPALRDHVDLLAGDPLIGLLGLLGIGEIEIARLAVHERVDPEPGPVLVDADVDRQRNLRRIADDGDLLGLPFARGVRLDEPDLGR